MTTVTVQEAKDAFGSLLSAAERGPVTVSCDGRNIATLIAVADLEVMARAFLSAPLRDALRNGRLSLSEALLREAENAVLMGRQPKVQAEVRLREAKLPQPAGPRDTARRSVI